MNDEEKWLAEHKLQAENNIKKLPFAETRYNICKNCEHFISKIMVCRVCYCFMPGKTSLKGSECPLGKWGQINEE